jgi:exonuclease III
LTIILVFWNPRGIVNKATEFKHFLEDQGAVYAGLSESQTYKEGHALNDAKWNWEAGTETSPSEEGSGVHVARGIGALTNSEQVKASVIRKGKYTLWHRLDVQEGGKDLAVGTAYFPNAQDIEGHTNANEELRGDFNALSNLGYSMVLGGDFNAHTGSNGDTRPTDKAGNMFLSSIEDAGMILVNTMPNKCSGGPTRVQVHKDDTQESTLDYIVCTPDLAQQVESMQIMDNQMGSDHRPLVLTLSGMALDPPPMRQNRVVWKRENIVRPDVGGGCNWSWVGASREKFSEWLEHMKTVVRAAETAKVDATATGNLLEWSFQLALDELAGEGLGTRVNKPKDTPPLYAAARAAI